MTIEFRTESIGSPRQVLRIDAHTLYADLSTASGSASAPAPHDYFDAALAACRALTATVYAKARGIALDRVIAEVARDNSQVRQGTYVLSVNMTFEGALSDEEKRKLHEVTDHCPIHKLMTKATVEVRQSPLE